MEPAEPETIEVEPDGRDAPGSDPRQSGIDGPQWDQARNAYIQWDPELSEWMEWSESGGRWIPISRRN